MDGLALDGSQFLKITATVLFAVAVLHTFFANRLLKLAHRYPEGSIGENILHLLGEVEVVFGLWAAVFALVLALAGADAVQYLESRNYTEPLFVFVIMAMCATRPILDFVERLVQVMTDVSFRLTSRFGISRDVIEFVVILIAGPLLGSLITEPAAMTVCALMLSRRFFARTDISKLKYAMMGLLFVNISIGGTLTSFAAPPVLMVAPTWGWTSSWMFVNFGWKAALACVVSTVVVAYRYRRELSNLKPARLSADAVKPSPGWLILVHALFVAFVVAMAHHPVVFVGSFLFFLGFTAVTAEYQEPLKLRESLLVGFFLAGLVVLGGPQGWWLEPVLARLESLPLFVGAASLTAVTDNAALTYLGSLVPNLSDASKYALVAGAVAGGGLTVIANAPNPAGYGILVGEFGADGIAPFRLFIAALLPTLIASMCFLLL